MGLMTCSVRFATPRLAEVASEKTLATPMNVRTKAVGDNQVKSGVEGGKFRIEGRENSWREEGDFGQGSIMPRRIA